MIKFHTVLFASFLRGPVVFSITAVVLILSFTPCGYADLIFDWATVGNPGNAADTTGRPDPAGAVAYTYRISKHEVTNNQYAEFLNKVASTTDPNGLFNANMDIAQTPSGGGFDYVVNAGFETNPVNDVSFLDAMRFTNWLENGQGTSGTESGVYSITTGSVETRAAGATYFIPSEDEWYKAAYHDPNHMGDYWDYPTQSDLVPPTAEPPPGGANSSNSNAVLTDTTDVGAYSGSISFYGTFDQAGNVREWNETLGFATSRGVRGGGWDSSNVAARSSINGYLNPTAEGSSIGFRVASVPEPSSLLMMLGFVTVLVIRNRRNIGT